jgi:hypothetical protein
MGLEQFDTILAFAAVMLILSLLITILVQMAVAASNLRGRGLAWGMDRLLRQIDPRLNLGGFTKELTEAVLRHPAVAHLGISKAIAIRKEELIQVLEDLATRKSPGLDDEQQRLLAAALEPLAPAVAGEDVARSVAVTNELLKAFPGADAAVKQAVERALQAKRHLEAEVDKWFDTVMDRSTERFTLFTRGYTAILTVALVAVLHIDALAIFAQLTTDKGLRDQIVQQNGELLKQAEGIIKETEQPYALATLAIRSMKDDLKDKADKDKTDSVPADLDTRAKGLDWVQKNLPSQLELFGRKMNEAAQARLEQLGAKAKSLSSGTSLQLVAWPWPPFTWKGLVGMVMSALFLSLGAPFWFNMLKQLSTLRPLLARKVGSTPAPG